ncbi:RNA-dependent RNA polymerase [Gudgenby Calliphora mononega-like virus]|uniref:RNA-directed RNA polymerase L n=1 Tax=Gudgenby Calliphora mononega-like virus TaxID=2716744 RepID=A0A6G7PSB2_9MONO|nr:RNA-dependent RNA polymerase [Gudgenby Calliphora mononega-like virus]
MSFHIEYFANNNEDDMEDVLENAVNDEIQEDDIDQYFDDSENFLFQQEEKKIELDKGSFIPSHLSMPIVDDDIKFLLKYNDFYCKRHKAIKNLINRFSIDRDIYNLPYTDPYELLQDFIKNNVTINENILYNEFLDHLKISFESLEVHKINFLGKSLSQDRIKDVKEGIKLKKNFLLENVYKLKSDFFNMKKVEKLKDAICSKRINFGEFLKFGEKLLVERDVFLINFKDNTWTIGPTNLLLCVLDLYQSRLPKKLYWLLSDANQKYPCSMFSAGCTLITEFEGLRREMKNDFFKFLATWEALVLGSIIKDEINDLGFKELYESSKNTMEELLSEYNINYDLKNILPQNDNIDEFKMYVELTGNKKHFGHPCLEVKSGFDNVRNYGTESVFINMENAISGAGIMRRDFVKNFILKRSRWPPCIKVPEEFKPFYKKGEYPTKYEKDYTLWGEIQFDKVFDYDLSPDTSELIKDSSAATEFQHWFADYDSCAFRHLYNKSKPRISGERQPTRVIQLFLQGNEDDLPKKIHEMKQTYFNEKDSTAILCRKEQELKPDGRLFVKQTYHQRLGQTSMESNIAHQYMRYVPEQTMTDGEIPLMRRLAQTAKSQKNETVEIFNLDLSKWNMRFRHALVLFFGEVLDEVFDSGDLYKNNHLWFLTSNVFCNSRLAPPDYDENLRPIPGDFYYNNQLGGMEGMRQKLWTIITVCLIKLAAEKEGLKINIMCQGDNQVVMVHYSTQDPQIRRQKRESLLSTLEGILSSVNLILKREETWFSMRLCEFGKVRYFDGEAISNADTKINRCIPDINDGVCSIMSSLSTINTITEATAKGDYLPDTAFIINQFMVLNYLSRKEIITSETNYSIKFAFLYHPTDFGGICLSTYFAHTLRGYDDKLTLWISLLKTLSEVKPHIYKVTLKLNNAKPKPGTPDHTKLVEDIFSLNIDNLPSVEKKMKNLALIYLNSNKVTNPEVTKLFKNESAKSKEDIVSILKTMKPFVPSLAHEILRNSNIGIILNLRNRMSNIGTINKMIQELNPKKLKTLTKDIYQIKGDYDETKTFDFLQIANDNNKKVCNILRKRTRSADKFYLDYFIKLPCPTEASTKMRIDHWKIDIIGASKSFPPCQFKIKPLDDCSPQEVNNSILITLSDEYANVAPVNFLKDGPYNAYLGSATKEKVKKPTLDIVAKTSFTKSLQQLHLIKSWCQKLQAHELVKFLDILIEEKSDLIPEELEEFDIEDWCALVWGGNLFHRFRSQIEKDAAVTNFLPTVATHIVQSTNNLSYVMSGGRDFTIHFQLVLIYNIATVCVLKEYFYLGVPQFCAILTQDYCTQEVTDIKLDIQSSALVQLENNHNIISKERVIFQELQFSTEELEFAISVHLGRLFGKASNTQFMQDHISDKATTSVKITKETAQVSINDLKYVNFKFFVPAIISTSNIIKKMLIVTDSARSHFQHTTCLTSLANFLHNGKLIESFIRFLGIKLNEHYQGLDPNQTSVLLYLGISDWFSSNHKKVADIFLDKIFRSDTPEFVLANQQWYKKYIRIYNPEETISLQEAKLTNNMHENKELFYNYTKIEHHLHLNRRMEEERVIFHLRAQVAAGKIKLPDRKQRVRCSRRELPSELASATLRTHITSFYSSLSNELEGIERYKELHQLARPHGQISTSINKIEEILLCISFQNIVVNNIYCLAEGSGSIIEGLGTIYPQANLFYNSLLKPNVDMRQGADQDYPPSVLSSKSVNLDRIKSHVNLSKGETDITKPEFLNKLEISFSIYPPDIITMDAESNEISKNVEIFYFHINLLAKFNTKLIIYKMFLDKQSIPDLQSLHEDYPDYFFFLIKPLCSNPNNEEYYLVGLLDNYITTDVKIELLNMSNKMMHEMGNKKLSTKKVFDYYLETITIRNRLVVSAFPWTSKPDQILTNIKKSDCGSIFCKKFTTDLINLILDLDLFDHNDSTLYPIIRNGGVTKNTNRSLLLLISVTTMKILKNIPESIYKLTTTIVNLPLRGGEILEGCVADGFRDWKWLIRYVWFVEGNSIHNCRCNLNRKDFWTRKSFSEHVLFRTFSAILYKLIGQNFNPDLLDLSKF